MSEELYVVVVHHPDKTLVAFGPLEEEEADLATRRLRQDFELQADTARLHPAKRLAEPSARA